MHYPNIVHDLLQEAYDQLQKTLSTKWDFVVMQAEEQVIEEKQFNKEPIKLGSIRLEPAVHL